MPCDLEDSARALDRPSCRIYTRYLIDLLRKKIIEKNRLFPGGLDVSGVERIQSFREFDDRFTAPMHGFNDALDYWRRSSCKQYLGNIRRPACLINARNDPFLGAACFPTEEAGDNPWLTLVMPTTGGHVGFMGVDGAYWSEWIAMRFLMHMHDVEVQNMVFSWRVHDFCA